MCKPRLPIVILTEDECKGWALPVICCVPYLLHVLAWFAWLCEFDIPLNN